MDRGWTDGLRKRGKGDRMKDERKEAFLEQVEDTGRSL